MKKEYEEFENLIGCYFHIDWDIDGANTAEIIAYFKKVEKIDLVAATIADFDAVIKSCEHGNLNADEYLKQIFCGYYYQADNLTGLEWIKRLRELLVAD